MDTATAPTPTTEETYRVRRADLDRWVADGLLTGEQRDRLIAELTLPPPPPRVVRRETPPPKITLPAWVRPAALTALTLVWLGGLCAVALGAGPRVSLTGPASWVALLVAAGVGLIVAGMLLRRVAALRDVLLAAAVPVCALAAWGVLTLADVVPSARAIPNYSVGRYSTPEEEAGVRWGPTAEQRGAILRERQDWRVAVTGAACLAAVALAARTRSRGAVVVASGLGWLAGCELLARLFGGASAAFWLLDGGGAVIALGGAALVLAAGLLVAGRWRDDTALLCGLTALAAALLFGAWWQMGQMGSTRLPAAPRSDAALLAGAAWLVAAFGVALAVAGVAARRRWRHGLIWAAMAASAGVLFAVGMTSGAWSLCLIAFALLAGAATVGLWPAGAARRGGRAKQASRRRGAAPA